MYRFELARRLYRNAESGGGKEFFKTDSVFEEDNPFSRYRNRSIISRAANIPMRQKLIGNGKAQRTRHMRQALTPIHAPWRCFSPFGDYSGQIDPKLLIDGVSTLRQGVAIVVQIQRSDLNQFSRNSHPEFTGKMVVAETCFFKFRRNRDLRLWGDLVRKGDRKPSGRALPVSGRTYGHEGVRPVVGRSVNRLCTRRPIPPLSNKRVRRPPRSIPYTASKPAMSRSTGLPVSNSLY